MVRSSRWDNPLLPDARPGGRSVGAASAKGVKVGLACQYVSLSRPHSTGQSLHRTDTMVRPTAELEALTDDLAPTAPTELPAADLERIAAGKDGGVEGLSVREAQRRGVYKPFDPLDHPGPPFWP